MRQPRHSLFSAVFYISAVPFIGCAPVNDRKPAVDIIRAQVVVQKIICVLPDIESEDRKAAARKRRVLIGTRYDRKPARTGRSEKHIPSRIPEERSCFERGVKAAVISVAPEYCRAELTDRLRFAAVGRRERVKIKAVIVNAARIVAYRSAERLRKPRRAEDELCESQLLKRSALPQARR